MAFQMIFFGLTLMILSYLAIGVDPFYTGFHPQPFKNWLNDPNGPMYFNGYYHLFFQYNPNGPKWGDMHWYHMASKDCIHWQHLPVALAPDKDYDCGGIFSGSATIVDNVPVLTYSVACGKVIVNAYPLDVTDPLLKNWTKPSWDPVMKRPSGTNGFRDPTTAWKGKDGMWRQIIGCDMGTCEFKSHDFKNWSYVGVFHKGDGMWECPDFYPIPGTNTYVLKASAGGDWWASGQYIENSDPTKPDSFVPHSADIHGGDQKYDHGQYYASKVFYDPVQKRQVLFGWVNYACPNTDWTGVQSFPRKVSLHPVNKTLLVYLPIKEISTLYETPVHLTNVQLAGGVTEEVKGGNGNQLDISVVFKLAPGATNFGIDVFVSGDGKTKFRTAVTVQNASNYMVNTDLPGGDYSINNSFGLNNTDPHTCQKLCQADDNKCKSWTFIAPGVQQAQARCCLKSSVPSANPHNGMTSGVMGSVGERINVNGKAVPSVGQVSDIIKLRILVDHSIVEVFAQDGLLAITSPHCPAKPSDEVGVQMFNAGKSIVTIQDLVVNHVKTANVQPPE